MEKLKQETYYVMDYPKLDGMVKREYGRDYSFIGEGDVSNNTLHQFIEIDGKLDEWEAKDLQSWLKNTPRLIMARTLLQDLCRKNIIPKGDYLIDVSW